MNTAKSLLIEKILNGSIPDSGFVVKVQYDMGIISDFMSYNLVHRLSCMRDLGIRQHS